MILVVCIWNLVPVFGMLDISMIITLATPTEVVFKYAIINVETDGDIYWFITAEENINSGSTIRELASNETSCGETANQADEDLHEEDVPCELTFGSFYFLYTALDYDGQGLDVFIAAQHYFVVGTGVPTLMPTVVQTNSPTFALTTLEPSSLPTLSPTTSPTSSPSQSQTNSPTSSPSLSPANSPTSSPSQSLTNSPTSPPTLSPTNSPTSSPSLSLTNSPTSSPTLSPTNLPTSPPTRSPTESSTEEPTVGPTVEPTTKKISGESEKGNLWIWFVGIIASIAALILGLVVSEFYCPTAPKRL